MKDAGQPHHSLPWMVGGVTRQFLNECFVKYHQVSNRVAKGRTELAATTTFQHMGTHVDRHIWPLHLHPAQLVRLMLLNGNYMLSSKLCNPGADLLLIWC